MAGSCVMTSRGRALAALLLGVVAWRAAATTRIPQNMDKYLLNVIKHNLRRNNDDYIDRLMNDDVNAHPLAPRTPAGGEPRLRAPSAAAPRPLASPAAAPRASRRDLDTFDINDILGLNENNQNTSTEGSDPADGKNPSQTPVKSRPAAAPPPPAPRAPPAAPALRKRFSPTKGRRPAGGKAARSRGPPRADILDMAPAKGSRINAKREKGRLCQRHVLLPEGPKYDAWGTAYLLAHSGRRPFPGTRTPRLLLPACCNCCKKSALGCE